MSAALYVNETHSSKTRQCWDKHHRLQCSITVAKLCSTVHIYEHGMPETSTWQSLHYLMSTPEILCAMTAGHLSNPAQCIPDQLMCLPAKPHLQPDTVQTCLQVNLDICCQQPCSKLHAMSTSCGRETTLCCHSL